MTNLTMTSPTMTSPTSPTLGPTSPTSGTLGPTRRPRRDERGAATLETVIVVPALLLMLGLIVAGSRVWFARATTIAAAEAGARAATLARTAAEARADGKNAAEASLSTGGLQCRDRAVWIDTSGFAVAVGLPATVRATVTCRVTFADLLLPEAPGAIVIQGTGASALDSYRERS
ncbi:MAG TPA: TadE family protein [Microlunatus sp.]|nr:TadE family protein [Microlunatus sp.]